MLGVCGPRWTSLVGCVWMISLLVRAGGVRQDGRESATCRPGFYCVGDSQVPEPCPRGTYGPSVEATSKANCLSCPPQHYCPRPGLPAPLPCGAQAEQPLEGQSACVCLGDGRSFQASDGQCPCALGYEAVRQGDVCALRVYHVCRDGSSRSQHGICLDPNQWEQQCREKVCVSPGAYQGYDGALGMCVCREAPGGAECGNWGCRARAGAGPGVPPSLQLMCDSSGELSLGWRVGSKHQGRVSGRLLERVFQHWDSQGILRCGRNLVTSRLVHSLQTSDAGFLGLLHGLPEELVQMFSSDSQTTPGTTEGTSKLREEEDLSGINSTSGGGAGESADVGGARTPRVGGGAWNSSFGILNPTACLQLGDVLLFSVSRQHHPQYDMENLYNTNSEFDWGPFRQLEEELTLSWTPPTLFSLVLSQPGVYVFRLSSQRHKHMYVRVMPAGGQCYEMGPFFPAVPRHMTRMGIARQRNLLLRPDWLVTGGLVVGTIVILSLCVTLLILFREYGWPDKEPVRVRYRALQKAYLMDDYSSRGSRVTALRKTHRNLQGRMDTTLQPAAVLSMEAEEFWDYEQQVDLEAFSSTTFYRLLLSHSLAVTSRLGQLTGEVKELYQGVQANLRSLQPMWSAALGRLQEGEAYQRLLREVEREVGRRRTLAQQTRALLDSQLQVLRSGLQDQRMAQQGFTARLRESLRLLGWSRCARPVWDHHSPQVLKRVWSLVGALAEQVRGDCHRQGAWALLGEGTGARLLCPDTGVVLTKDDIFTSDGSLRVDGVLHSDPITGLIRPGSHAHMLLGSGHSMVVPPDFFLHPQTCRLMPIAGNVAYDPNTSTLILTTDCCYGGSNRKWECALLPFIPYPISRHCDKPLPSIRLRGLRPGQKLQLGGPMLDPDSGLLVPILAVTIHPQTGLVYPLGGVSVCPLTRLPQPIQLGSPMLDPRTGNVVLTAGVGLDPVTGAVLPVGGVLLGESFIDPLSGRLVRVGGASIRAGQLVPHAGGYQTLLDCQVLLGRLRVVEQLRGLMEEWSSRDSRLQPLPSLAHPPQPAHSFLPDLPLPNPNSPSMTFSNLPQPNNPNLPQTNLTNLSQPSNPYLPQPNLPLPQPDPQPDLGRLQSAVSELQQVWRRSLHCQLQLQTRLEMLLDWASAVALDGGLLGELPLPDSELCVPALLGQEYPDPQGSGLQVPVLGAQLDPLSGRILPLAGTMVDLQGKGLVAIRCGALALDPVTGGLATVVGARMDLSTRTVVPMTAPYWLALGEHPDSIQVEALQKEVSVRISQWQQQEQKEEELLSDLDTAVQCCLHTVSLDPPGQDPWADSERQLRGAVLELQESGQSEAQSRAARQSHLALVLPPYTLHTLTTSDDAEWKQRCVWQAELQAGLDLVSVCVEGLQQDQERQVKERELTGAVRTQDWALRQRELWEQLTSRQAELDSVLSALHSSRLINQLHAETAQAVLSRKFWYRDYGLGQPSGPAWTSGARTPVKVLGVAQQKILVLLERLTQLLEQKPTSLSPSACCQHLSGLSTKQAYGLEACSPVWTASLPVVKGISTQSLREPIRAQGSRPHTHTAQRHTAQRHTAASSGVHSQESQPMKEHDHLTHICVPTLSGEEWDKLLDLSPLFQLIKGVELQLRGRAREVGLLRGEACDRSGVGNPFVDVMDAQWECEGELIPLEVTSLNLRETLVLQHGLFLLGTLHSLGLWKNDCKNDCVSHIAVRDLGNDHSLAFQRVFFKALQACMGELFQARLGGLFSAEEASSGDSSPLLERLQRPSQSLLSQHTPAVSLQIAANLPTNNYHNNTFRNSFFYKEVEETVFVRRQRMQCVGGFSLLLIHCVSHIAVRDLGNDHSLAFQRVFFKALQACMGELFQARLGGLFSAEEASSGDSSSLLERLQRPSQSLLSQHGMQRLQQKHSDVALLHRAEDLLREMSSLNTY